MNRRFDAENRRDDDGELLRVTFEQLFSRTSKCQMVMAVFGLFSAMVTGATAPTIAIILGKILIIFDPINTTK